MAEAAQEPEPHIIEEEDAGNPVGGFPVLAEVVNHYQNEIDNLCQLYNRHPQQFAIFFNNTYADVVFWGDNHAFTPNQRLLNRCIQNWLLETCNELGNKPAHQPFPKMVAPSVRNLYQSYRHRPFGGGALSNLHQGLHRRFW